MSSNLDNPLDQIIEDAANDVFGAEAEETEVVEPAEVEAAEETETPEVEASASEETEKTSKVEVKTESTDATPLQATPEAEAGSDDEFSKRFGIPTKSVTGKENRIPYSRVKSIISKNEKDTEARLAKKFEDQYKPKLSEFEGKVKDYEGRLTKVNQFEQMMTGDPQTFLSVLSTIPAYKPFFDYINKLADDVETGAKVPAAGVGTVAQPTTPTLVEDPADPMPQPNKPQADGSKVYDLQGLQSLLAWQERRVTKHVSTQFESTLSKRLGPFEQRKAQEEHLKTVILPELNRQIAEAEANWPGFKENETEITAALDQNKNLSLEGAYRMVVLPKLSADRSRIRTELLAEIKRQPVSTAVASSRTSPRAPQAGPRSLEDIVLEEARRLGGDV